jgi:tetratricopeptide (TPR) repeat protein
MLNLNEEEEVREFLAELPDTFLPTVLHLLTCERCRLYAVLALRRQLAAGAGDLGPSDYGPVFAAMEAKTPGLFQRATGFRQDSEQLLAQFLDRSERGRWAATKMKRFHHPGLMDLLLEHSHAIQLQTPREAATLARLTLRLLQEMTGDDVPNRTVRQVHAYSLAGNAWRLAGRLKEADAALREAVLALRQASNTYERGFLCRYLGLLRWEQDLLPESLAFLDHAATCYQDSGSPHEVGTCRALQGLLLVDERQVAEARPYLRRALRGLVSEALPGLGARTLLGAALCEAEAGEREAAVSLLQAAWPLYTLAAGDDLRELILSHWLEARVQASLGEREQALELLESVRQDMFRLEWWFEATAATADMALVLAASGRVSEIEALARDTETLLKDFRGARAALLPLRDLAEVAASGGALGVWAAGVISWIRDVFQYYKSPPQPVLFA